MNSTAAISRVVRQPVELAGAGRTDAGVHGWGQVVTGRRRATSTSAPRAASTDVPPAIAVRSAEWAEPDFSARFSATWRVLPLRRLERPGSEPAARRRELARAHPLDLPLMQAAVSPLIGEHDFSSFCRSRRCADDQPPPSMVRIVHDGRVASASTTRRCCGSRSRARRSATRWCARSRARMVDVGLHRLTPADVNAILHATTATSPARWRRRTAWCCGRSATTASDGTAPLDRSRDGAPAPSTRCAETGPVPVGRALGSQLDRPVGDRPALLGPRALRRMAVPAGRLVARRPVRERVEPPHPTPWLERCWSAWPPPEPVGQVTTHRAISTGAGRDARCRRRIDAENLGASNRSAVLLTIVATMNSQVMANAFEPRYDLAVTTMAGRARVGGLFGCARRHRIVVGRDRCGDGARHDPRPVPPDLVGRDLRSADLGVARSRRSAPARDARRSSPSSSWVAGWSRTSSSWSGRRCRAGAA